MPRRCDSTTNDDNALKVPQGKAYEASDGITVTDRDAAQKNFSFRGLGRTSRQDQQFTKIPWADENVMWVCCPTTIPSACTKPGDPANPSNPPQIGAIGTLFVTQAFAKQIDLASHAPKWPAGAPLDGPYAYMTVVPTRLTLEALDRDGVLQKLELRDFNVAEQGQSFVLDANGIHLRLTQGAFKTLGSNFPVSQSFPKQLTDAADALTSEQPDPGACAQALTVVATAVEHVRKERLTGQPSAQLVTQIQRVLPQFFV